jgi:aminobenzoyl-glutamate utilization protein B
MLNRRRGQLSIAILIGAMTAAAGQAKETKSPLHPKRLEAWKAEAITEVERSEKLGQEIVDSVFSFGELGFQETETSRYLKEILVRNGFAIEDDIAGIPTAWMATWGSGKPVIALGSDIDGIPRPRRSPASPTTRL